MARSHSGPDRSRCRLLILGILLLACPAGAWAGTTPSVVPLELFHESCEEDVWDLDWMLWPEDLFWSETEAKIKVYFDATAKGLDTRVRTTLPAIDGMPRQLLAMKYYLARSRRELRAKWAWTSAQEKRFRKSPEFQKVVAEVEKVRTKFAELNPGFTLRADVEVRSLREQIASWNQMPSVASAAGGLMTRCIVVIADTVFTSPPTPQSLAKFRQFLTKFKPTVVPTVAVPGLSAHGQLRAFDFVVMQGNKIVASTETATIRNVWDRSGWTTKLKDAVKQSGAKFEGPLASPREPWHYSYKP